MMCLSLCSAGIFFCKYFFSSGTIRFKASAANVDAFIEKAKRYTDIPELTPELLQLFIERIEVGERATKYSRHSEQSIRIVYRDIGAMDSVEDELVEEQTVDERQVVELTVQEETKEKTA